MTGSRDGVSLGRAYRAGIAVAAVTSFVIVWTTIVRDDGNGIGFFLVIMAAWVAGFAASFRPAGMARAMVGVAAMQVLLGIAIATAPSTASLPGASFKIVSSSAAYTVLWLIAALRFRTAAKGDHEPARAP